tara:strand:- start:16733 stop:17443 length:711 start_codon:yes stop_codon:yes gene_type:complete
LDLNLSELSQNSEHLLSNGLNNPGFLNLILVFLGGLLTSLGPCSLSLLPITVAYLAGFKDDQGPISRSVSFCSGIILSLVILGLISSLLGNIFGQLPFYFPKLVALLAILMGLNLLGLFKLSLPVGPDPNTWYKKVPQPIAPISSGLAFGLAASPCSTPVLAVLLAWIAKNGNPLTGVLLLCSFGAGQVIPLMLAGTAAASIPNLLGLRPIGKWVPPISGTILIIIGSLNLLSNWI